MAAASSASAASEALSEFARKNRLSHLLGLARVDRNELHRALKALGYTKMGHRAAIEMALLAIGMVPDLQPMQTIGSEPIGPWIVATHAREDVGWMVPLLQVHPTIRIIIYECGIEPLPVHVRGHERIEIRDKSGHLAPVPFFYGVFDFCASHYDVPLPEYVLFVHGHDTGWHQRLTLRQILEMSGRTLAATPGLEYINLNDKVMDDWILPGRSMVWRVAIEWDSRLNQLLGEKRSDPPRRIAELYSAQALVHRNRILARSKEAWVRLRAHAGSIIFHSEADLALEGSFHRVLGEPWCRPFVEEHLEHGLRQGTANELELRASATPHSDLAVDALRDGLRGFFAQEQACAPVAAPEVNERRRATLAAV